MWIEQYKSNREGALVQLMQFFINASGCRGKVTPDMAQMDHTLIIKKMTQEFDEVWLVACAFLTRQSILICIYKSGRSVAGLW